MIKELPETGSALDLAARNLEAVRSKRDASPLLEALSNLETSILRDELNRDARRKAFWINLYNARAQELLEQPAPSLLAYLRRFNRPSIRVAGLRLSLNDIEHGILRRSQLWWAMGYLRDPFPGAFEREQRVDRLDPRIHFALNCAATSCPPIRAYLPDAIDEQLDLATLSYLEATVSQRDGSGTITLPALLRLFQRDFGGRLGMLRFVAPYINQLGIGLDPEHPPRLQFDRFDRSPLLNNFST